MADVKLQGVKKSFGSVEVLHGIDLHIEAGEFVVFVGPSGCGKSTLLRVIAGLEEMSGGTLLIGDTVANKLPPGDRGIAMVFQSYALYPHMSVYDNMAFGLRIAKTPKAELDRKVRSAAEMLQLTPYLDRLPRALSGGQRQRVAIGRAITRDPKVFLFDEPLSNLDAALRVATRIEIANLKEALPDTTMVYVTHDQVEAMTLADRIVVLNAGRIEQVGSPMDLYENPANIFVAKFIGSPAMNIVEGRVAMGSASGAQVELRNGVKIPVAVAADTARKGAPAGFGVRPEHLRVVDQGEAKLSGKITVAEHLGEVTMAHVDIGANESIVAKLEGNVALKRGDTVHFGFADNRAHLFDEQGKAYARLRASL